MKLICISTEDNYYNGCSITVGNVYEFSTKFEGKEQWISPFRSCVYIIDDYGWNKEYPKTCFKELSEYRNEKLEQMGI